MLQIPEMEFQERVAPSRPSRLGHRRRRAPASALTEPGASWPRKRPPSLDTNKQLQTSSQNPEQNCRQWLDSQETEWTRYIRQIELHSKLLSTFHKLWQDHAEAGNHALAAKWEKRWLRVHNCRTEWIGYAPQCCGDKSRAMAVPVGCNDRLCPLCAWDRSRAARKRIKGMFPRLTHPVLITLTVPNVPLYKTDPKTGRLVLDEKTKKPIPLLSKRHYEHFRKRVLQFVRQHKSYIKGGVYSMETTFNRTERGWHIHVHILADLAKQLPAPTCADCGKRYAQQQARELKNRCECGGKIITERVQIAGRNISLFTANKMMLEFDWLRLWTNAYGKRARSNANERHHHGERYNFEAWVQAASEHRVKVWSYKDQDYVVDPTLSAREIARRTAWNKVNRRVIDIRPVTDRDGAAREVLKYITKAADFWDVPEAVESFSNAVVGARLIQTFGSWYGALECADCQAKFTQAQGREHKRKCPECGGKIITFGEAMAKPPNPDALEDWAQMKCVCGCNFWRPFGVLYRQDVEMDPSGRWLVKQGHQPRYGGTAARPTIRAQTIARGKRQHEHSNTLPDNRTQPETAEAATAGAAEWRGF